MDVGENIREVVREHYGKAARSVLERSSARCCGAGSVCSIEDQVTSNHYDHAERGAVPEDAVLASLGCGNPTALAELREGEVVLDLGAGGGIDVLLSARRVGPTGFAYGLDMTDEMLELAERNRAASGATNVKFLKGTIEHIPLPDNSVDVIISNCVINLSADKDRVFAEALRVLKPGGRFAVSDIVVETRLPDALRKDLAAYVGCVAGALAVDDYIAGLERAGFVEASVEPTRRYWLKDSPEAACLPSVASMSEEEKGRIDGRIMAAFIRARKAS